MLSRDPKILSFAQKSDGTYKALEKETLEVLLITHFFNCMDPFCNAGMMPDLEDIINIDKVKWAISSLLSRMLVIYYTNI